MLDAPKDGSHIEQGLDQMARHARTVLVAIAGINLGAAGLMWMTGSAASLGDLAPQLISGVLFAALAMWARRGPMAPVMIGVAIYGLSLVAALVAQPSLVLSMWGLLLHGVLVILCVNGVSSARAYRELQRNFGGG